MSAPVEGIDYAELHCLSNFSFQRGASSAAELFERAKKLGYRALAITDECSLAGIVRAWQASKETEIPLITGSELNIEQGPKLVLLAENLAGYENLCRLLTHARRRAEKGSYRLVRADFDGNLDYLLAIWLPRDDQDQDGLWLRERFPERLWLGVELHKGPDDAGKLHRLREQAARLAIPAVACGDVHMHIRGRRALQDCMTAIRQHLPVHEAGQYLYPNGERHLRPREALAAIYPDDLLAETLKIAERCTFDLGQLDYQYPRELVPEGHTPTTWLREKTEEGILCRWKDGADAAVRQRVEDELALIAELEYDSYFLTVYD
ncbi:PHP domain-containing protein, partial [Pseudomonas nitroreducens]